MTMEVTGVLDRTYNPFRDPEMIEEINEVTNYSEASYNLRCLISKYVDLRGGFMPHGLRLERARNVMGGETPGLDALRENGLNLFKRGLDFLQEFEPEQMDDDRWDMASGVVYILVSLEINEGL